MEHTPAEKPSGHKVKVPISAREGHGPNDRFEVKRSTFSGFFLRFSNGYVEDSRGCRAPRGYCRAPGGAWAALGEGKTSSPSDAAVAETLSIIWRGFQFPITQSQRRFSGVLIISSALGSFPLLTCHRFRGREHDLRYGIRTRCVQKTSLFFLWPVPIFLPLVPAVQPQTQPSTRVI